MKSLIIKILSAAAAIILPFTFLQCIDIPTDVIVPQWTVELNVPLLNRDYSLQDIIKSQPAISISEAKDSLYLIQSDTLYSSAEIGNFMRFEGETNRNNISLPINNMNYEPVYIPFPAGVDLDSATFKSGEVVVRLTNPNPDEITIDFKFPGIIQPDGQPAEISSNLQPLKSDSTKLYFNNDKYRIPSDQSAENRTGIQVVMKASTSSSALQYVNVDFVLRNLTLFSATGKIPKSSLGERRTAISLPIGNAENFRNKIFLNNGQFNFTLNYFSPYDDPFSIELKNLTITGKRTDGNSIKLKDINGSPYFDFLVKNGFLKKELNSNNSNITDFVTFMPDSVIMNAEYIMNPENGTGSATIDDLIKFKSEFSTESYLALKKSTINDTSSIELTDGDRDLIRKGKLADINIKIENSIPLTTWVSIVMADKNYNPVDTITRNSDGKDSLYFPGAEVNEAGEVIKASNSSIEIKLDSASIRHLAEAYYALYAVSVRTKDAYNNPPPRVFIRASDRIKLKVYGTVKALMNFNK